MKKKEGGATPVNGLDGVCGKGRGEREREGWGERDGEREREREMERERGMEREREGERIELIHLHTQSAIILPRNVPKKNGNNRTPMIGEAKLINQFGRNGVIRKNIMYHNMSSW